MIAMCGVLGPFSHQAEYYHRTYDQAAVSPQRETADSLVSLDALPSSLSYTSNVTFRFQRIFEPRVLLWYNQDHIILWKFVKPISISGPTVPQPVVSRIVERTTQLLLVSPV